MSDLGNGRFGTIRVRSLSADSTSEEDDVVDFPLPDIPGMLLGHDIEDIPNIEIAYLISAALKDALIALGKPQPDSWLQLQACERRSRLRERFARLPRFRASDEVVLLKYRKAIVFQNASLELALNLTGCIRRYSKLTRSKVQAGIV